MKKTSLLLVLFLLAGCDSPPPPKRVKTIQSPDGGVDAVELYYENDSLSVGSIEIILVPHGVLGAPPAGNVIFVDNPGSKSGTMAIADLAWDRDGTLVVGLGSGTIREFSPEVTVSGRVVKVKLERGPEVYGP